VLAIVGDIYSVQVSVNPTVKRACVTDTTKQEGCFDGRHPIIFLPLRGLLPSPAPPYSPKINDKETTLRKSPPTPGARHRVTSPRSLQPSTTSHARRRKTPVMTGSGVQKHVSYLPVIEPQRQNPCCRNLVLTCADAGRPSTRGAHDFGPPRQQAGTMNPPKNPTPNDPLLCPSGAINNRPTQARCPPCPPNPTPSHIHYVPHHDTPPPFQNPRLSDYPHHNLLPQTHQNRSP